MKNTRKQVGWNYLATCSMIGIFFQVSSNPLICRGGRERALTVELLLLISFNTRKADTVLFMYRLSICLISISSWFSLREPSLSMEVEVDGLEPSSLSLSVGVLCEESIFGKRQSSIASQSLTSLKRRSVVKKGCCRTFWMKGNRIGAPVLLSYFFSIFTSPVNNQGVDLINQNTRRCKCHPVSRLA